MESARRTDLEGGEEISRQAVCGTGFIGESRQWLRDAVAALGGRYCPHLIRHDCTHLVCHTDECAATHVRDTTEKMQRAWEWQGQDQLPIQVRHDAPHLLSAWGRGLCEEVCGSGGIGGVLVVTVPPLQG